MSSADGRPADGLLDYAEAAANFSLEKLAASLNGSLDSLNACVECCDRHVPSGGVALEYESQDGRRERYTFAQMQELSARFAGMLTALGVKPGDAVAGMLPRTPALLVAILGTWRAGAVYQPLFTAFGPKAIEHRLQISKAKLVVTDNANRPKLAEIKDCPAVAVVRRSGADKVRAGDLDFGAELAKHASSFEPVMRSGNDTFMLMSTSGTTGLPKGVAVPLKALLAFYVYMRDAVDLRPEDKYWNIADPGWAYGLYYAVAGALFMGNATTFYDGPFTAESTYRLIKEHGITNLGGSPTAYRLLIAAGPEAAAAVKGQLRAVASAGEPLNPEVIRWFAEHLAVTVHDQYGQTELGMVVNNHHRLRHPVHPGSAGFAMPGFRVAVLDDSGKELAPNIPGELAIDLERSPLNWFGGYYQAPTPAITGGYYRTGDTVELEPNGAISFVGRADDVITSSGYRIGPFDVESALIEHQSVMEAAAVGKPDLERTEIVKAFVVLKPGFAPTPALADELQQHVKRRLSAHAYPREIEFVEALPKTPSGKVQRFLLRGKAQ
jgi:acetyl-CoA synthetase